MDILNRQAKLDAKQAELDAEREAMRQEEGRKEKARVDAEAAAEQAKLDEQMRRQRAERRQAFVDALGSHAEDPEILLDLMVEVFDILTKYTAAQIPQAINQLTRDLDTQAAYDAKDK